MLLLFFFNTEIEKRTSLSVYSIFHGKQNLKNEISFPIVYLQGKKQKQNNNNNKNGRTSVPSTPANGHVRNRISLSVFSLFHFDWKGILTHNPFYINVWNKRIRLRTCILYPPSTLYPPSRLDCNHRVVIVHNVKPEGRRVTYVQHDTRQNAYGIVGQFSGNVQQVSNTILTSSEDKIGRQTEK